MILDTLEQLPRYERLNPHFKKAFEFIRNTSLHELPRGRHEIDGLQIFALADIAAARRQDEAPLEAHRKYVDIQLVLGGVDVMGWKNTASCRKVSKAYDPEKDIEFFADSADAWVAVHPGQCAIFFPEDAHAPLVGEGELHKIVIKVALH